jgi:hypothetical protein
LRLTLREAIEQLFGMQAVRQHLQQQEGDEPEDLRGWEEKRRGPPLRTVREDDEARKLADMPHLTGDPEWDAVELAETDPSRSPLNERMRGVG